MKRQFVFLLISSILLTQCYTQKEYLTKDYRLNDDDELKRIVLADSTEHEIGRRELYKIESDSILILVNLKPVKQNGYSGYIETRDTLNISEIHSYFKSEFNLPLSIVTGVFVGVGALYLMAALFVSSSDILGD